MKFFKILLLTTVIILSTACERKLKYDGDDNNPENITLTVMASPDTTLEVMAGRSFVFTRLTDITEDAEYVFNISASLRFGHVYYSINGGEQKKMTYDDEHHRFVSDYRPSVGDHIAVNASEIDLPNVSGSTIVPSKPTLEVVDAKYVAPEEGEVITIACKLKLLTKTTNNLLTTRRSAMMKTTMTFSLPMMRLYSKIPTSMPSVATGLATSATSSLTSVSMARNMNLPSALTLWLLANKPNLL